MPTLAEIQEEMRSALDLTEDEIEEIGLEKVEQYLDFLGSQEARKADGIAQWAKFEAAQADMIEAEGRRLIAKASARRRAREWMMGRWAATMAENGVRRIKGNAYTLSLRASESVRVDDFMALKEAAPDLVRVKVEESPDKGAIKDALKSGRDVPGCRIVERETLQVR